MLVDCQGTIFLRQSDPIAVMDCPLSGEKSTVPLNLELAQTVAIGAFNPYVVTPDWLVRYNICREVEGVNVRFVALGEGAAFRFGKVEWQVDNQRLCVSSSEWNIDCGRLVSRVLELLPHTPVHAVGHNFHFSAPKSEWGGRPSPMLGRRGLADFEEVDQVRWAGAFRRADSRLEVTLASEADAFAILFNHHRTMNLEQIRRAKDAEDQIAQARTAAERFLGDFDDSRGLLRSFFEMELPDE